MSTDLATKDGAIMAPMDLSAEDVVKDAAHKAAVLKREVLDRQPKPILINGQRYARYEDWQTLARERPEVFAKFVQLEADKPPTQKNGIKLSIMGFRTIRNALGEVVRRNAPTLIEFIQGVYKPKEKPCKVCGADVKATKAAGCGYLP